MAIRTLILQDGSKTLSLMDTAKHFMVNPQGLGYANSVATSTIPSGSKFVSKQIVNNPKITGDISFGGYKDYEDFNHFVSTAKNLELKYSIDLNGSTLTNVARINVESYSRNELGADGRLTSRISIIRLTNWFNPLPTRLHTPLEYVAGFKFPTRFPIPFGYKNPHYKHLDFTYGGSYKAWVNVEMSATVEIPHVIFRDVATDKVIAEIKAESNIGAGLSRISKFIINSTPWDRSAYAILEDGSEVSILNKLSIDDGITNFVSLPKGSYKISVDDLEPDTVGSPDPDTFTFTFVEEKGS